MNRGKGFLLGLIGFFGLLVLMMMRPFFSYLLGALILGFVIHPVHSHLKSYIGENASALFLTFSSVLVFLLPFAIVISMVSGDASQAVEDVIGNDLLDIEGLENLIESYTGEDVDIRGQLRDAARSLVSAALGGFSAALGAVANIGIGVSIMLFAVFYLLKDGLRLRQYLAGLIPLPEDIVQDLFDKTNMTTWAVIKGHVLVALAQGGIAGVGLWIAGVSNPVFWTFIMTVLSFIPIVGSMMIWGPAGVYLAATGNPQSGIFLLVYGLIVVNLTDNFLRPFVVDDKADLHPMVILIGVIGGVYVFGATGLFIGPVVFGVLKAVLNVFNVHYENL